MCSLEKLIANSSIFRFTPKYIIILIVSHGIYVSKSIFVTTLLSNVSVRFSLRKGSGEGNSYDLSCPLVQRLWVGVQEALMSAVFKPCQIKR